VTVDTETGEIVTPILADPLPPTAASDETAEKDILLGRIQAGMDMLRLKAADQMAIWTKHCGTTRFASAEADVTALSDLLAELQTTYKKKP